MRSRASIPGRDTAHQTPSEHIGPPRSIAVDTLAVRVLPKEIAFLAAYGVRPGALLEAAEIAEQTGVTAETALFCAGSLDQDTFYRCLALHLGLRFLDRPPPLAAVVDPAISVKAGMARLVPNCLGLSHLMAPQGSALRSILSLRLRGRETRLPVAITTPRRFSTMARQAASRQLADHASYALLRRDRLMSAHVGLGPIQAAAMAAASFAFGLGLGLDAAAAVQMVCALCGIVFLGAILAKLLAIVESPPALPKQARRRLPAHALPTYSIIVALYDEACLVDKITAAMDGLDYPRGKLDIKIVVEACDRSTIAALAARDLPAWCEIVVAPPGFPRTKPRALNVALPFARGDLVTVYDAEDEPDPQQLRDAAARFARAGPEVGCLQAKLAIDNTGDGWLARLFAIEYAALFDVLNPGLAALNLPILLGGTSNHFRTEVLRAVGGWDAWNVTEDADLGIRLARHGYRVETLDSTTYEEAPAHPAPWLRQRRRWLKGWMRTLVVHSRRPARLSRDLGLVRTAATLSLMSATVLAALFGPLFVVAGAMSLADGLLHPVSDLETAECVLACMTCTAGLGGAVWAALLGLKRRGWLHLCTSLALLPIHYALLTAAAWWGLAELCFDPHFWGKTKHGMARTSRRRGVGMPQADTPAPRPLSGLSASQA